MTQALDQAMVERIQHLSADMSAGDAGAVEIFCRDYFDWMYAQARRTTRRDESFCLDVVQAAVLRVVRTVKPVDDETQFRGWLRLVVQATAFDLLRQQERQRNRQAMTGGPQPEMNSDSLQLDWLREQIAEQDPELVNLIELRLEKNRSLRNLGEKLGLPTNAMDRRLRRAMKHPRLIAEDPPFSDPFSDRPEGGAATILVPETPALRAVAIDLQISNVSKAPGV